MSLPHRKGYATAEAAMRSKAFLLNPGAVIDDSCRCGLVHVGKPAKRGPTGGYRPSGEFTPRVKLLIRTRAGFGDPHNARCECCGIWLGISGGQFQHRAARGAGGCRETVINGTANGVLLCGTTYAGCHGRAETRDSNMERAGFWIRHGTTPEFDPRNVPVFHHRLRRLWLPEDSGLYLTKAPRGLAA